MIQRHDVASTLRQRCIDVMCLLGYICTVWSGFNYTSANFTVFNTCVKVKIRVHKYENLGLLCHRYIRYLKTIVSHGSAQITENGNFPASMTFIQHRINVSATWSCIVVVSTLRSFFAKYHFRDLQTKMVKMKQILSFKSSPGLCLKG